MEDINKLVLLIIIPVVMILLVAMIIALKDNAPAVCDLFQGTGTTAKATLYDICKIVLGE